MDIEQGISNDEVGIQIRSTSKFIIPRLSRAGLSMFDIFSNTDRKNHSN